jgi:hypothetical protein
VDGAAEAVEEARAQRAFEFPDVLRQRRLAQVEHVRGPPEAPGPGNGQEDLELPQGHGSGFPYRIDLNIRLDLIAGLRRQCK